MIIRNLILKYIIYLIKGRCIICGAPGISDAYYCRECTLQEKDVSLYLIYNIIVYNDDNNNNNIKYYNFSEMVVQRLLIQVVHELIYFMKEKNMVLRKDNITERIMKQFSKRLKL